MYVMWATHFVSMTMCDRYHTVSNMSFVLKLTEQSLIDYDVCSNLQEQFQTAYKLNHSTETALMGIQHGCCWATREMSC